MRSSHLFTELSSSHKFNLRQTARATTKTPTHITLSSCTMTAAPFKSNPATMNIDPAASFPCRLHRMLTDIDELAKNDPSMAHLPSIISWCEDGKSFKIHDRKKFIGTVMPIFFSRLKYSSFVRGISGHGFTRLRCQGPVNGAMFHPSFIREEPQLACTIEKIKRKSKSELAQLDASRPSRRFWIPNHRLSGSPE